MVYLLVLTFPIIVPSILSDVLLIMHILLIQLKVNKFEYHLCKQLPDLSEMILGLATLSFIGKIIIIFQSRC